MAEKQQISRSGAATIRDVAALAGVSIKTVSRVINGEPHVRSETAARVRVAVRELNYRPNLSARSLPRVQSYQVALWSGLHDSGISTYCSTVQSKFVAACARRGYGAVLDPMDPGHPDLFDAAMASVVEKRPCGVVLTPPFTDYETLLTRLENMNIPFVLVSPGREVDGRPFVTTDDFNAARAMTEQLIALGHDRIGFITGHPDHGAAARRLSGFIEAHRAGNAALDDRLLVQGDFTFESGVRSARRLLALTNRPTAIFAGNDDMAAGVVHLTHEQGLRIPGDVSIVGFDDTAIARYIFPSITTVHQPLDDMIDAAVDYLVSNAKSGLEQGRETLAARFACFIVNRDSVGPPAGLPPADPARRPH